MVAGIRRYSRLFRSHPITRSNPFGAWTRLLRWQMRLLAGKGPRVAKWLDGAVLVLNRGTAGGTGNLYCGLHEFDEMALLLHYYSQKSGRFLDVGANLGSYTILASKVCGVPAIAVEPIASTFNRLRENIQANAVVDLVQTHCMALGEMKGTVAMSQDKDAMNRAVDRSYPGASATVPMDTIDNLLSGEAASFWKIDVEGFETRVLAGAKRSLNDPRLDIVVLESNDREIEETMSKADFTRHQYDPFRRELIPPTTREYPANHIWIRDPVSVMDRVKNAPLRTMHGVTF